MTIKKRSSSKQKNRSLENINAVSLLKLEPSRSQQRKIDIIHSAIKLIAEVGIESTSFEAIGKPLKMTKAHVAYHYKNKEEIILKAIELVIAEGQQLTAKRVAEGGASCEQRIRAICSAAFEWTHSNTNAMAVYLLFFYYSRIFDKYRDFQESIRSTGHARIIAVLSADDHYKGLSEDDKADLASAIQSQISGALVYLFTSQKTISQEITKESEERCWRQLSRLLDSYKR